MVQPLVLFAVRVYTAFPAVAVGVPLMMPVEASRVIPVGKFGEMVKLWAVPAVKDGVTEVIVLFALKEALDVESEKPCKSHVELSFLVTPP